MSLAGLATWRIYVRAMGPTFRRLKISEETAALILAIGTTEMRSKSLVAVDSGLLHRRSLHTALSRAGKYVKSGKRSARLTAAGKDVMDDLDAAVQQLETKAVEALVQRADRVGAHYNALYEDEHPAGAAAGEIGAASIVPEDAS
jgi:hypothetical protein